MPFVRASQCFMHLQVYVSGNVGQLAGVFTNLMQVGTVCELHDHAMLALHTAHSALGIGKSRSGCTAKCRNKSA